MPEQRIRLVVIDVDTPASTTVALASAKRHLTMPVSLLACGRDRVALAALECAARDLEITLTKQTLLPHGDNLDRLYRETDAEILVHLDSDAEILNGSLFAEGLMALKDQSDTYGVSWLQRGARAVEAGIPIMWYAERPWIPLSAFRVSAVRSALADDQSFQAFRVDNDLPLMPHALQRGLAYRRFLPWLRNLDLESLNRWRQETVAGKAPYLYYDTGARLHEYMVKQGKSLFVLDWADHDHCVRHEHGVTRSRLRRFMPNAANWRQAQATAMRRLHEHYAVDLSPAAMARLDAALSKG